MGSLPNESPISSDGPVENLAVKVRAQKLPEKYFAFLAERSSNTSQAASIMTPDNLRVIKGYVRAVRKLSRTEEDIKEEADYELLGVEVDKIIDLNKRLHRHVDEWDKLERQIKELGPVIELFAKSMKSRGGALIESIEGTAVFQRIASEKNKQGGDLYTAELTGEERSAILSVIDRRLGELIKEIEQTKMHIDDVDERATWFHKEIEIEIKPHLKRVNQHIDRTLKTRSDTLVSERDDLDSEIEALSKQYSTEVGYAFTGLVLGPLGLIVTGGIFGSQAEDTRARKNNFIKERDRLSERLVDLIPAIKNMEVINAKISDLKYRTTDLISATQRLADVWLYLSKFASTSLEESRNLSTSTDLEDFVQDFVEVIRPWGRIGDICHTLSALFNQLLEEHQNV